MFDLPPEEELSSEIGQHRQSWLDDCRSRDYVIVGGGLSGLTAGIYLQQHNCSSLIITEADHLGGRLTWDYGPVPVFQPADELLHDLEYPLTNEPPLWLDRTLLLNFLVTNFYDEGGVVLTGGFFDSPPVKSGDECRIEFTLAERAEIINAEETVTTLAKFDHEERIDQADTSLDKLVLNTIRRRDGIIQAGVQALNESDRASGPPLESALLLSGRKAAELILDEQY